MPGPVVNFGMFPDAVLSLNGVFLSKVFNSEDFGSGSSEEDIFTGEDLVDGGEGGENCCASISSHNLLKSCDDSIALCNQK
jgi:hypothetical protein